MDNNNNNNNNNNFNSRCDIFKNEIIQKINNSNLPAAIIYYILKDIFRDVQSTYIGIINSQSVSQTKTIKTSIIQEQDKTE